VFDTMSAETSRNIYDGLKELDKLLEKL